MRYYKDVTYKISAWFYSIYLMVYVFVSLRQALMVDNEIRITNSLIAYTIDSQTRPKNPGVPGCGLKGK